MKFHNAVTVDHVKAECARRIVLRYPLGKQNTIIMRGGEGLTEMQAFIERMIECSHALEAGKPIRYDYSNDRHW